jgi:hypothetical protein
MPNPHLPAELLDHVVDHLHDTKLALRSCCLVSKSWIPRTRKHLFANINFNTQGPAIVEKHVPRSLHLTCALHQNLCSLMPPGSSRRRCRRGWLDSNLFSRCALEVGCVYAEPTACRRHFPRPIPRILTRSSNLSTCFYAPFGPSHVFDLICSFPLLEDLSVIVFDNGSIDNDEGFDGRSTAIQPSSLPAFTGTLELDPGGTRTIFYQLLSLPSGLHFRKLDLTWNHEKMFR